MIISFSGIDGSGKTTIIKEMKKLLVNTGIRTIYRHECDYFFLKYLFKLAGEKRVEHRRKHFLSSTSKKTLVDKLWSYLVLIDAILLILWFRVTKRKTIVILDRFLYDQLVSFEGLGVIDKKDRFIRWLYLNAPGPDIRVILTVSPSIAFERKKETHNYPINFYTQGNRQYLEIAKKLQLRMVNTDQSLSNVVNQLLKMFFNNDDFLQIVINKWANNRTIYKAIKEYRLDKLNNPYLKLIIEYYNEKVKLLKKTLLSIKELMAEAEIEWLLFKTYMPFSYVPTYDVDILIHPSNKRKLISFLEEKKIQYREEEAGKINIRLSGLYTISIHLNVGWEGNNYVSSDFMWKNVRNIEWYDIDMKIPSPEGEILSHIAHIFFELSFIRLSDALYLLELIDSGINWKEVYREVEYFGWKEAFDLVIHTLNKIKISLDLERGTKLPYSVPYWGIMKVFVRIISTDIGKNSFSIIKTREYLRQTIRYAIWRIGERIVGRAPFGELLFRMED